RIAEIPSGMLNSVGLQNPGIHGVLDTELRKLREVYSGPVIANISGFSQEEYVYCCRMADESPDVDMIEVNISCPNVHEGGMSFGTSPDSAGEITKAVRKVCAKPVF